MERADVTVLLAAGPSVRFDVLDVSRRLLAAGQREDLMFRTAFLNRSILLKHVDRSRGRCAGRPIQMLIYLPYDSANPEHGGESLVYSAGALRALHAGKTGVIDPDSEDLRHDIAILDRLDELSALNPFLLREIADGHGVPIPEPYLQLSPAATAALKRRLERRVRPLIVAALGSEHSQIGDALSLMVEAFVTPTKRDRLRGLAAGLHLDPDEAVDVLGAWAGIAFFEDEVARLKPDVHRFLEGLMAACEPLKLLPPSTTEHLPERLNAVRAAMRSSWIELRNILEHYQTSYEALVFRAEPHEFVAFLRASPDYYWRLGEVCAHLEQSVRAWADLKARYPRAQPPRDRLASLVGFLEQLFESSRAVDTKAAS